MKRKFDKMNRFLNFLGAKKEMSIVQAYKKGISMVQIIDSYFGVWYTAIRI